MKSPIIVAALSLLASGLVGSDSRVLVGLNEFDQRSLVCGCVFHESVVGASEGGYGSGPLLFAIAPNAEPPHALVNRGVGNIKLSPMQAVEFPMFQCEAGEEFVSGWIARNLVVRATLNVVAPGEDACWFTGDIVVHAGMDHVQIPVKGACGC